MNRCTKITEWLHDGSSLRAKYDSDLLSLFEDSIHQKLTVIEVLSLQFILFVEPQKYNDYVIFLLECPDKVHIGSELNR